MRLTTLPPSCVVMKSGNLNFLEPAGPLQACNGTDFTFLVVIRSFIKDHARNTRFFLPLCIISVFYDIQVTRRNRIASSLFYYGPVITGNMILYICGSGLYCIVVTPTGAV